MTMPVLAAAAAILFMSLPATWAHREGARSHSSSGSRSASESLLAAASAAGISVTDLHDAVHNGAHKNLRQCQESQQRVDAQQSVKKMADCVSAIASFAQETQSQRAKSLKANKNYANDLVLAKNLLKYLVKQTDTQEHQFREFQNSEKQRTTDIEATISRRPEGRHPGPLLAQDLYRQGAAGGPNSLMSMYTQGLPLGYQAAVFAAGGQSFGVPSSPVSDGGLVGRRPSQLQVDTAAASSNGLQASLDGEAAKLEENDARDLQG